MYIPGPPRSLTFFRCFLMRMDPLSVHFTVFFFALPFVHCAVDDDATFFSLTQMSISEKR